jgi:protein gp37
MGDTTGIGWTDHTFNSWWGCARVSPACRFCYADTLASRWGHDLWHQHGPRRMLSEANWAKPLRWNHDAEAAGKPARVFCASMADVFEDYPDLAPARHRLWQLIGGTPWLVWQLLTKRVEHVPALAPWGSDWPPNVWLGTSVENQRYADERIPVLASVPARTRFLSCEPLLGPADLSRWLGQLSWVITGGESGPKRREMNVAWLTSVADQCQAAGVPVYVKQDSGPRSGLQGRIPAAAWALKQFPAADMEPEVADGETADPF